MRSEKKLVWLILVVFLSGCNGKESDLVSSVNPPAPGFDLENSDPAAVELADSIMVAMGGREHWDNTRYISWSFFGFRNLIWDKKLGRVRIDSPRDSVIYLVDLNTLKGRVRVRGHELQESDSLQKMLSRGKSIWINDSYWLVMPFKLKDSGVTITYMGEDTLMNGNKCNVLKLTFNDVGDTPKNKYHIYVDLADNLVKQWAYYSLASQDSADFMRPWDNYKRYGNILLSADRSDDSGPKNVSVDDELSDKIFTEF